MRETRWGPLRFTFRFGDDGQLAVAGTPLDPTLGEPYRRAGAYRREGDRLVTPALNEGMPVEVRREGGRLFLKVEDGPEFWLDRG